MSREPCCCLAALLGFVSPSCSAVGSDLTVFSLRGVVI